MLTIIGHVQVQPERRAEFERLFLEYAARVKANEPGALVYQLNRSRDAADGYAVIEIYRDQAALEAHRATAYFQPAIAAMAACLAGEPRTEFLDSVD
jgi:quinol monooxygenase YgiN